MYLYICVSLNQKNMKNKLVLSGKNLPTKLPIPSTLMYVTALHYWNAPEWLWGIFFFAFGIFWIYSSVALALETQIDLFEDVAPTNQLGAEIPKRSRFQERMDEAMKK